MSATTHPAVQDIHDSGAAILAHVQDAGGEGFWRRWFSNPFDRDIVDDVRSFIRALGRLLDVPPTMIAPADLTSIGDLVNRVVAHIEGALPRSGRAGSESLGPAIYLIRKRYEELHRRGATKRV